MVGFGVTAISQTQAPDTERQAVLATVDAFFEALAAHDGEAGLALVMPEGRMFSVRYADGKKVIQSATFGDGLSKWKSITQSMRERIWNADVRVRGDIATVWTPYDFHMDGKFSHCGINALDLVKTDQGWKLSGGMYTVETESCEQHPDGPLKP